MRIITYLLGKNFIRTSIGYIKRGQISDFLRYLKEYLYGITHYSTDGNLDIEIPSSRLDTTKLKIAVYTCITGHYESLAEPLFLDTGIDYYAFTDGECPSHSKWKKVDITQFKEYKELSPTQLNREIKMLPFKFLSGYDYTIYIDGNIEIADSLLPLIEEMGDQSLGIHYHRTRDCIYDELVRVIHLRKADKATAKRQIATYKKEGFPRHYGLYENSILIRNHHDEPTRRLMEEWWVEYQKYSTRDQLSLPYLIWKLGYDRKKIHIIGHNLHNNPRFNRVHSHDRQ